MRVTMMRILINTDENFNLENFNLEDILINTEVIREFEYEQAVREGEIPTDNRCGWGKNDSPEYDAVRLV